MQLLRKPLAALALGAGLAVSPLANATLVLDDGTVFYGFVSGSGKAYRLTLRMDFTSTLDSSDFLGDRIEAWSLQLPGAATSTLAAAPDDALNWSVYGTAKAVGGNNGCGNGNVTTICVDRVDNSRLHGTGPVVSKTTFDWVIDIAFAVPQTFTSGGNFHLLSVRPDDKKEGEWKKDAGLISLDLGALLTCVPSAAGGGCEPPRVEDPPVSVPEPGSLALIGFGAVLAGALRRRQHESQT